MMTVDGQQIFQLSMKFQVYGFPAFWSVAPNSNGSPHNMFMYQPRSYETLKRWVLETLKDVPVKAGSKVPKEILDIKIQDLKNRVNDILSNHEIRQSDTALEAFGDTLKRVSESAIRQSSSLDEKIKQYEELHDQKKSDPLPTQQPPSRWSLDSILTRPSTGYFMLGLIFGASTSLILVIYMNSGKIDSQKKTKKKD